MLRVNGDRLLRTIDELGQIGRTNSGGLSRLSLSPGDIEARKYIIELMEKSGLEVRVDPVANVIGLLNSGSKSRPVASGSHVDTVINGGRLDGAYGTLGAIEALRAAKEQGLKLTHSLAAICFTNEEGVRFPAVIGSKYIAGLMELEEAYSMRDREGKTYKEALNASGLLPRGAGFRGRDSLSAFVELHIEQGPILEHERVNIGLVESIVGVTQYDVSIQGSADHAGTTPMNLRKDALMGMSEIILEINRLALDTLGSVGTVGSVTASPNAPNVVAGEVKATIDFRHSSDFVLEETKKKINDFANLISKKSGLTVSVQSRIHLHPAIMSSRVVAAIEASIVGLGLGYERMQSGAGHDAMIMNRITETGMIFVPSRAGKSHSPLEATDPQDLINGANVLLNTLTRLAA